MTTEVICALITVGGTLLSSLIAFLVSRTTANKEIEKMKLTWEREDAISTDEDFSEMAAAVAKYIACNNLQNQTDALAKIAAVRLKESEDVCTYLDLLSRAIRAENLTGTNAFLTEAIDEKREAKTKTLDPHRNKPKKH